MAVVKLSLEICCHRLFDALSREVSAWPESKVQKFEYEWRAMEGFGAEIADVKIFGGRIVGFPSEDFTAHCAAYGAYP